MGGMAQLDRLITEDKKDGCERGSSNRLDGPDWVESIEIAGLAKVSEH